MNQFFLLSFLTINVQLISASFDLGTCNLQCEGQSSSSSLQVNPLKGVRGKRGSPGPVGPPGPPGAPCPTGSISQCNCSSAVNQQEYFPQTCSDLVPNHGVDASGVYEIYPFGNSTSLPVYCDLSTAGGGWLVIQRRQDGSENFYRNFDDYVEGFGRLNGELWLGLNTIHELTKDGDYEMRVDMEDFENETRYAYYSNFVVGPGRDYSLRVSGYQGNAGDDMQAGSFSAKDVDQDIWGKSCAQEFNGAWWYTACHRANPNGLYLRGRHDSHANGVNWLSFRGHYYSLKIIDMKIRRK